MKILNVCLRPFNEKFEYVELMFYIFLAAIIPIVFKHPQLLVGSVVNTLLVLSALHFKGIKSLIIAFIPSLSVVCVGLLFGNLTHFLIWILPFIWIGNIVYMLMFKRIILKKQNVSVLIFAPLIKAIILGVGASILIWLNVFPLSLLNAFSITQLITGIIGGLIGYGLVIVFQ